MKICFVIQDCTTVGGTERATCRLASEMARRGHEVSIVSIYGVNGKCAFIINDKVGFEVLSDAKYGLQMSVFRRMIETLRSAKRLKKCRSVRKADILICQKFFAVTAGTMAGLSHKMIAGEHFPYLMYGKILRELRNCIFKKAKRVVVLTESCAESYGKVGIETTVIPDMVSIEGREHCEEGKRIVAAGRLAYEKGFDMLVEAFARENERLKEWKVEIYGEGECRGKLEKLIHDKGMDGRIELKGNTDDIAKVFEHCSFGVVSSRFESFSLVTIEAAACGVPMVAFDCPVGPREILKDGGGLLVENGNIEALGQAIVRMANERELRLRLGKECAKIAERYSAERVCSQWEELLKK